MHESTLYASFVFGIYPGGEAGSDTGIVQGPAGDPPRIERCLTGLQGDARPFILRVYERFSDDPNASRWPARTPVDYERYVHSGRLLDLVIQYSSAAGDVESFLRFAIALALRHAPHLYSVQVTEEANFTTGPDAIDGPYPGVQQALIRGVPAVKRALREAGHPSVKVGFNSTPTFGPHAAFWSQIGAQASPEFHDALDYVGLDFFPDVFRPAADVQAAALGVLETMRNQWLPGAGIPPRVPIHVAEHGWPTASTRSEQRQAEVLETVIRAVYEARQRLNIQRYTLFALRDANSSVDDIFYQFGVTRDDYSPKLAYSVAQRLIAELGSTAPHPRGDSRSSFAS